jgi:MFS family permease
MSPEKISTERTSLMVWVILSLYPLVGMGVDLIAPSLPAISHSLQASSAFSKNLITLYLLGYALGSFLMGFLSDTLGRRRLVIGGFLIFSLASLLPVFFPTEATLLLARGLQGFTILLSYLYSKNIWVIALSSIFMYLACGIIYPACMARGMSFFRHLAGSSTAIMILINVMITAMISFFISGVHVSSAIALSWIYVCLMMLGMVVYWILIRHDVVDSTIKL